MVETSDEALENNQQSLIGLVTVMDDIPPLPMELLP
jgi:hypothetical protein